MLPALRGHPCLKQAIVKATIAALGEIILIIILFKLSSNIIEIFYIKLLLSILVVVMASMATLVILSLTMGIIAASIRVLSIIILLYNYKFIINIYLIFMIIYLLYYILKYGRAGEPLIECKKIKFTPIFASITTAGLLAWYLYPAPLGGTLIYISSIVSSLYLSCIDLHPLNAIALGATASLPGIGGFVAALAACAPSQVGCGQGQPLWRIVGLAVPGSMQRSLARRLELSCRDGVWRFPTRGRSFRLLVVGSRTPSIRAPVLRVKLTGGSMRFEDLERSLKEVRSRVSSGDSVVIELRLSDRATAEGLVSVTAAFVGELEIPVVVEACAPSLEPYVQLLARSVSDGERLIVVRVCFLPSKGLVRLFTGPRSARIVCSYRDPEIIRWALESVLGVMPTEESIIADAYRLLRKGMCFASNVCGIPGAVMDLDNAKE